ncbi:glycolate oxidase subunit GlcE [Pelagibacterium limicola]|uniref:glycolate oxidase subunit GlcE n=1 Tax=Pelagibacterium limicola TaxID=2791022 RepID=UPI0018AFD9A2
MNAPAAPQSEDELAALIDKAVSDRAPLSIVGGRTRGSIGGRGNGAPLSTRALTGITLYEPAEMVISARAGTPLAEIESALATKGQMLPFEPMDHRALLGTTGTPTIGAIAAGNISGPRRVSIGAARDHLIGVRLVNGYGDIIKSGGRVMKNVTGLDLVKLSAGAFGTLGVLTEVTFKVLPRPETAMTLSLDGLSAQNAVSAMAEALATPFEISAAAHVSANASAPSLTFLRLEGFSESCTYRAERLSKHLDNFGTLRLLEIDEGTALWQRIRDAEDFAGSDFATVLRVHVAPSKAGAIVDIAHANKASIMLDWGGGLIWLGLAQGADASETIQRISEAGGHPMIVKSAVVTLPVLTPASPAIAALARKVKHAFDPHGIFNPGLLAGHI